MFLQEFGIDGRQPGTNVAKHTLMANKRKFSAAVLLSLLAACAFAQTATTDPVGFVSFSFKQGVQYVGVPMVNAPAFTGRIASATATTITFDGATLDVGSLLTAGTAYYLEVVSDSANSGAYVGDRMDVDTSATIASADASLTVKSSPENTIIGGIPSALVGASVVVRSHVTLGQLSHGADGLFVAGDKVYIRVNGGAVANISFNGTKWSQGLTIADSTVVYPGVGFALVRSVASQTSGVVVGSVRTNNFVQVLRSGEQVLAEGFPVDSAPNPTSAGIASRLFTNDQGASFSQGDRLFAYNPNTGVFSAFTYNSSLNVWAAGLTNGNSLQLFNATKGVYLFNTAENDSYVHVRPFSL